MNDYVRTLSNELDDIAEQSGGYVDHNSRPHIGSTRYDYRAILHYCRDKNIQPIDMTIREMQQFVILQDTP